MRPAAVLVGGDLTGKETIFVSEVGRDRYVYVNGDARETAVSDRELKELRRLWGNKGFYSAIVPDELRKNKDAPERLKIKRQLIRTRLTQWLRYAESAFAPAGIRLLLVPGNDDPLDVDVDISSVGWVENVDGGQTLVEEHPVAGLGYSNETPWHCPRELSEAEITVRLNKLISGMSVDDVSRLVLVSHVPPFGSGLDIAPEISGKKKDNEKVEIDREDAGLSIVPGGQSEVGSKAVRAFIENHHPMLVVSGHCHDSPGFQRLGTTLCINPGSTYGSGVLRTAIVLLKDNAVLGYQSLNW